MSSARALAFPNESRTWSEARHAVCFWGHDSALEIVFFIDAQLLCHVGKRAAGDERSLLQLFDECRARIQQAAVAAYTRRRQDAYQLSPADF
jgi:hypothetical protein